MSTLDARPVILGFALVVLTVSSAVAEAASPRERYTVGDPPVSDGFSARGRVTYGEVSIPPLTG
jgi:hypothetical protein